MTALGWRWVVGSLVMAVFSLFALAGFSVPSFRAVANTASAASPARTFRLVSFNVDDARNIDFLFEQAIPRWDADVIVFQACVSDAERAFLRALPPTMRMRRIGEFCIASAHPVVGGALIPINPPQISGRQAYAVHLRIKIAEDTVSVVAVHLASPRDELRAALEFDFSKLQNSTTTRALQAERLSRYLSNIREPVAIAGDFNTLEDSQIYKKYFGMYTNAFGATNWGFGHTMQGGFHRLRIDHVLTGAGMRPLAVNTEWNWPTEHRPVIATLAF
jgi:endonuclease/exonuclease/phosphatase (EEP) superfamily protein YafD